MRIKGDVLFSERKTFLFCFADFFTFADGDELKVVSRKLTPATKCCHLTTAIFGRET